MKSPVLKWVKAYNSHDIESLIELYHEKVINAQHPYPKPVQGKDGMRSTFQKLFQAFPDIRLDIEKVLEENDGAVIEWVFSGTMRGDFAGHLATGRRFSMHGCEVFQFLDDKIISQHGYWDKKTMFDQLGI